MKGVCAVPEVAEAGLGRRRTGRRLTRLRTEGMARVRPVGQGRGHPGPGDAGGPSSDRLGIRRGPVTADDLHPGTLTHPPGQLVRLPVGQHEAELGAFPARWRDA
ncbi:hypothetical protein GCM10009827_072340 [Dactylosporangium maewongense]|uniref:Uncharacterized protein n=1 Tax=Dactylosporangium maewongense TaxID=634393 RepID=A0ABN2BJI6_9ACTN